MNYAAISSEGGTITVDVIAGADTAEALLFTLRRCNVALGAVVADVEELPPAAGDAQSEVTICALTGDAVKLLQAVHRMRPDAPVLLVAPPMRRLDVLRAIEAGADGLVADDDVPTALWPTLNAVTAGQVAFPRSMRHELRKPVLSVREKQVLGMVVIGFSNGEVADKLFLAESTVKSHLTSAFSKLGVRSRKEAAALILDPDSGIGTGILTITGDSNGSAPNRAL